MEEKLNIKTIQRTSIGTIKLHCNKYPCHGRTPVICTIFHKTIYLLHGLYISCDKAETTDDDDERKQQQLDYQPTYLFLI